MTPFLFCNNIDRSPACAVLYLADSKALVATLTKEKEDMDGRPFLSGNVHRSQPDMCSAHTADSKAHVSELEEEGEDMRRLHPPRVTSFLR